MRAGKHMFTIAFVCQKGGAGKTTAAIHTAVEGSRRGLKTLLIDIDPQASAAKVMDRRGDMPPDVATEAERAIAVAAAQSYDLVVVDSAPQADRAAAQAAKVADLVVIPLQPSILDLDAIDSTIDVCKLVDTPMLFLLNRVPTQGRETASTEAAIKRRGLPVASIRWGERKAFRYPFMKGLTAQEVEPDSRAAVEVAAFFDALPIPTRAHAHMTDGAPVVMSTGV
jgi:chromosome partitioning protein